MEARFARAVSPPKRIESPELSVFLVLFLTRRNI